MADGVGRPSETYRPRNPAASVLYQLVRDHFETFRAKAAYLRDGEGLPRFVEEEFRDFLCSRCSGRLRLVALVEQAPVIQRILRHLGLLDEVPAPRAPPLAPVAEEASAPDAGAPSNPL